VIDDIYCGICRKGAINMNNKRIKSGIILFCTLVLCQPAFAEDDLDLYNDELTSQAEGSRLYNDDEELSDLDLDDLDLDYNDLEDEEDEDYLDYDDLDPEDLGIYDEDDDFEWLDEDEESDDEYPEDASNLATELTEMGSQADVNDADMMM
jgi:hypothetical protein